MVVDVTRQLVKNTKNERIHKAFEGVQFVNAYRQPANLLRQLTHSKFIDRDNEAAKIVGLYKCDDKGCKICRLYIKEEVSFLTSNGTLWELRCFANCNSLNVIYFLKCNFCSFETYSGKTGDLRDRTNNHISCCRKGTGRNKFDNHVYACAKTNGKDIPNSLEPFFELHVMMVLKDYDKLLGYESNIHKQNHDTLNR